MVRYLEFSDVGNTKIVGSVQQVVQIATSNDPVTDRFILAIDRLVSPTYCITVELFYVSEETRDNDLTYILDVCGLENKFKPLVT